VKYDRIAEEYIGRKRSKGSDTSSMPIGLARNLAGVAFRCGTCEWFHNGDCWNGNPRLHGRHVDAHWCCNLYKHDGMKIVVR